MTPLTERQRQVLEAALSYAFSNADDLNDALAHDVDEGEPRQVFLRNGVVADGFREEEFEDLAHQFGIEVR
jgi:hypothetical protein